MLRLICLFLISIQSVWAADVRVLWWNIHNGLMTEQSQSRIVLSELYNHANQLPEIIVLSEVGEATPEANFVKSHYSNIHFQAFPDSPGYGIMLGSKFPVQLISRTILDFASGADLPDSFQRTYTSDWCRPRDMCRRWYLHFQITTPSGNFEIVPTHLYNPWRQMRQKYGFWFTAREVLWGQQNPFYYQLQRFKRDLQADMQNNPNGKWIVLGDFNVPPTIWGFRPKAFELLSKGLILAEGSTGFSFPNPHSPETHKYPDMLLDQAFGAGQGADELKSSILLWDGSPHFPLWVEL